MQSWLIKTIASQHTTYSKANKLLHQYFVVPTETVICNIDFSLLQNGYLRECNIWCKLILQTVYVNELTVELFFVLVKLHEEVFPLCLVLLHTPFQTAKLRCGRIDTDVFVCFFFVQLFLVADIVDIGVLVYS